MLTITTYDWVPEFPRGYVRDIRARWACEEAGLPYAIDTVPLMPRSDEHFARQPFGQVPMLADGDVTLFESGAILLHLGDKSETLMPRDPKGRAEVLQWTLSALNSLEMWTMPWQMAKVFRKDETAAREAGRIMHQRLGQLETAMAGREFIAAGLDGLEVDHRDNPPAGRERLRVLAARHGLLTTGSSDYHGANKTLRIGQERTRDDVVEQIIALGAVAPFT